jgi:hypothetical protein
VLVPKRYLKKPIPLNSGKSGLVGSNMPSVVLDFRAQATIAHLKLKGFFKCFPTASAEAKPAD